jgi:hypothetical protein
MLSCFSFVVVACNIVIIMLGGVHLSCFEYKTGWSMLVPKHDVIGTFSCVITCPWDCGVVKYTIYHITQF